MMDDARKRPFPFDGSADANSAQHKKVQLDRTLSSSSLTNGKHRPSAGPSTCAEDDSPAYKGLEVCVPIEILIDSS